MSTSEITPAPPKPTGDESPQNETAKGPYAMTQVNETIQREQQGLGPFVSKKGRKSEDTVGAHGHGGEPKRHFRLLSLSESPDAVVTARHIF